MAIREVLLSAVPGKLGGKTAVFMVLPEFKDVRDRIQAGIAPGCALEVELSPESALLLGTKKPMEGFKRAMMKLMPQDKYPYEIAVRGSTLYVVGVKEPPHKNGVPEKTKRKKK